MFSCMLKRYEQAIISRAEKMENMIFRAVIFLTLLYVPELFTTQIIMYYFQMIKQKDKKSIYSMKM